MYQFLFDEVAFLKGYVTALPILEKAGCMLLPQLPTPWLKTTLKLFATSEMLNLVRAFADMFSKKNKFAF